MKNKVRSSNKRDKKDIKVTYISSPVKVKTSASNFRALVQELTGQDSNVAETSMPFNFEANNFGTSEESVHGDSIASTQQWRVNYEASTATNLMKQDDHYSEFLSRSFMEQLNQHHLQYDLLSFDMS